MTIHLHFKYKKNKLKSLYICAHVYTHKIKKKKTHLIISSTYIRTLIHLTCVFIGKYIFQLKV